MQSEMYTLMLEGFTIICLRKFAVRPNIMVTLEEAFLFQP